MPVYCEVNDTTYQFSIEVIPPVDKGKLDQFNLLKETAEITAQIKNHYDATVAKYGRILGQERIRLLELLDLLFIDLVLINEMVKKKSRIVLPPIKIKVPIENRMNKYHAQGIIDEDDISLQGDFGELYNDMILDNIKEIFVRNKAIMTANAMPEESIALSFALDNVFYNLIVIRYNIQKCTLDR